ncbi:hypothetical protein QPK32_18715 [Massilia sp. YIM B02763]|uniref:hypothetical protein n=1 Tax=Massilia sp. YIM B02763 TaxID=3050130 RepID=UPI0025B6B0C7|nr:hypothetical protein [Massilia sp. YIM B02763]MDN4055109.1 hypothetical protein [Massilia sp. YIM B02763]
MDDDFLDEQLRAPAAGGSQHMLMVASLLHLMSHYTVNSAGGRARGDGPCVKLASVIERHLNALARLPDADPVLRATCEQLSAKWAALVDSGMPAPVPRRPLLARILRPVPRKTEPAALAT